LGSHVHQFILERFEAYDKRLVIKEMLAKLKEQTDEIKMVVLALHLKLKVDQNET